MEKARAESEPGRAMPPDEQRTGEGVVGQAKEKVQALASKAQDTVTTQAASGLERGKHRAADAMSSVAQALLLSSHQLRDQKEEALSRYVDQAATRAEQFSSYLRTTDVRQAIRQVEDVARRQPGLFLGGAFALGFLGARFLKSSQQQGSRSDDAARGTAERTRAKSSVERYDSEYDVTAPPSVSGVADRPRPSPAGVVVRPPRGSAATEPGLSASPPPEF